MNIMIMFYWFGSDVCIFVLWIEINWNNYFFVFVIYKCFFLFLIGNRFN